MRNASILSSRVLRDAGVGTALVLSALLALCFDVGSGQDAGRAEPRRDGEPFALPRTPVLERPRLENRWDAKLSTAGLGKRDTLQAPDALDAAEDAAEEERARRREAADRVRREIAEEELEDLRRYALLLPSDDAETFRFLVDKLAWAAAHGFDRPPGLEGYFFNRVFFAAGRWGEKPELRRAWIYLLRAIGIELDRTSEIAIARLATELFKRGLRETHDIERAIFGAELEGGDVDYWLARGYPSLDLCRRVWELRNEACEFLFVEWIDGIGAYLTQPDLEQLVVFLELFNLAGRSE